MESTPGLLAPIVAAVLLGITAATTHAGPSAVRGAHGEAASPLVHVGDSYPRQRHGRGGGVGKAIGIIGGAMILGKALEAAERQEKDKPRRKPRERGKVLVKTPSEPDTVTCRGGRVRSGKCVCDRSEKRTTVGRNVYVCVDRDPPVEIVKTPPPKREDVTTRAPEPPENEPPARASEPARPPPVPAENNEADEFAPDQVLVTFATSAPASVEQALAREFGLVARDRLDSSLLGTRVVLYELPKGRSVESVLAALRSDARLDGPAQANYFYRHQGGPSDVLGGNELQYALAKVEAPAALTIANGKGALIAVIDSAVDARHPDLDSAIADIYDATGDADYTPDAHGTAVAGILKARGTVRGIAPEAKLLAVRAFKPRGVGKTAVTTSFILLRSLDWAVDQNARILNLSFVGPHDPLFARAIKAAYDKGAIIVAAAGNNGPDAPPAFPGAYDEVIAVTATDAADHLYASANQGSYIAVAAPGVDVLVLGTDGGLEFQSGTSFAAPHVSGIIALMLERDPALTAEGARRALAAAAHDLGPPGKDNEFGAGRVNATRALNLLEQTTTATAR